MIEEITGTALKTLLTQGTGWVVATLCIAVIYLLSKKLDAKEAVIRDLFEKRLVEVKMVVEALNRSSEALAAMKSSVDARTEAINQLVAGYTSLARDLTELQRRIDDIARRP